MFWWLLEDSGTNYKHKIDIRFLFFLWFYLLNQHIQSNISIQESYFSSIYRLSSSI